MIKFLSDTEFQNYIPPYDFLSYNQKKCINNNLIKQKSVIQKIK